MKYNSIVISGLSGAGKGVLASTITKKYNWKLFTIGNIWRERWKKKYPNKEVSFEDYWKNVSFDEQKEINNEARKIISKGNVLGDFRYAICCKGIPALFIFIKSNLSTRAKRAKDTNKYLNKSIEELKEILLKREKDEVNWGKKLYGEDYDFRDEKYYNLILDSGKLSLEEELKIIDKKLNQ